ncbi:hypothetical protein LTR84_008880 [Exophiala bonariae]|uniref:Alpha/beta hydrolase fold-3 domain-containing protein n=1 Tax=Exophiala bonariae TaxID=1690606 RepID=A0AAV9MVV3_9EURO|nr:hypothetical protein LTR84_008880 [Exophiala bonariae]
MANLWLLLLRHPLRAILFSHSFLSQILLTLLQRLLLPHFPSHQSLRLQIQRAYLSSASLTFPDLTHRLPVGNVPARRARKLENIPAYLVPGSRELSDFAGPKHETRRCVALFAHGGGYARGEARMYLNYMERWIRVAAQASLDLAFLTVEYPLSTEKSHPAQLNAFTQSHRFLLDSGIEPGNIIFMGDSAGGGLCILSGIHLHSLHLPQPAATVLISPWLDMALSAYEGGNPAVETDYFMFANEAVPGLVSLFIGSYARDSPEVNPLHRESGDINGLSPQLIFTGGAEFARRDSEMWAEKCGQADVEHKLIIEWGQLHIYAVGSKFTAPAIRAKTDDLIIGWMKQHVK